MQTATVKNLTTIADQYAIVVEHGRILAPGTSFESGKDATVIVGTVDEIQAEASARNIAWPLDQAAIQDERTQALLDQLDQINTALADPAVAASVQRVQATRTGRLSPAPS